MTTVIHKYLQKFFQEKFFWDRPNGDHTAITTEQAGWFISNLK